MQIAHRKCAMPVRCCQIPPHGELRFVDHAGGCERLHTHDYWVLTTVQAGSLTLRIADEERVLRPGQVGVIPPHTPHAVNAYSEDFGAVYVLTLRDFHTVEVPVDDFVGWCEHLLAEPDLARRKEILEAWMEKRPGGGEAGPARGENAAMHRARQIKELLDAEIASTPYVRELVARFPGSQAHYNRLFKARYGVSLQTYFLNRKAERAKLLLKTELDLRDVSQQSGFFDQSHFTRVFRGLFQVTPRAFRQACRESSRHSHTR